MNVYSQGLLRNPEGPQKFEKFWESEQPEKETKFDIDEINSLRNIG